MREIKFRAWDKANKTMISPEKKEHTKTANITLNAWCDSENERTIIMQYTGLKDKDGVEIYEGDIMKAYGNEITWVTVSFINGSFELFHQYGKWGYLQRLFEINDMPPEVIGNIHENPDLLK